MRFSAHCRMKANGSPSRFYNAWFMYTVARRLTTYMHTPYTKTTWILILLRNAAVRCGVIFYCIIWIFSVEKSHGVNHCI